MGRARGLPTSSIWYPHRMLQADSSRTRQHPRLTTRPVVSPVNASRRPSWDAAHHSGSGWLARASPWGTFTSYSLPAFLAHSAGVIRVDLAAQRDVRSAPGADAAHQNVRR